jgi:acetyl-CoA carboxylase biotin carboxyl carrier protein
MRVEEIRRLIELVERSEIGELEVRKWFTRVRISKSGASDARAAVVVTQSPAMAPSSPAQPAPAAAPSPPHSEAAPAPVADDALVAITSPMVGTFYRSPAPDADPYVDVGSTVDIGQTVCIIEAMKLMNEIESEVRGRIVKMLVANATPVEFGQKLFLVDTSAG